MGVDDTEPLASEPGRPDDTTSAEQPQARGPRAMLDEGHYQLGAALGRGGMGEVVGAHDAVIGREVAIKRLLDTKPRPEVEARFLREAQIQGRLDHPSIPPVYELGRDRDGRPYIVMKRLSGTTLAQILNQVEAGETTYSREVLLRAFIDVCLAIEFAHARGVVHRDLKPSNIMLGDFGEVYVLDWGVAKLFGESTDEPITQAPLDGDGTRVGQVIGTPTYMAPEQRAARREVDGRADVYALGRLLCEILAGRRLKRAVESEDDRRPSKIAPERETAPELDALCLAATEPEPALRLPSARALADGVQRYLDGDRDLALRRELAVGHLLRAHALYDTGDHATAAKEAGRALALDPMLTTAADLVGRLLLETPATVPLEVERSLAADDLEQVRRNARVGMRAYLAYLVFVPAFVALGLRSPSYLVLLVMTVAGLAAAAWYGVRHPEARWRVPALLVGNAVVVGLFARIFSPFMIAPGIAAMTAMVLFRSPAYRGKWLVPTVIALLLGIAVPWTAEQVGWLSSTHTYIDGALLLKSPAIHMPQVGLGIGLMFYAACIVTVAALISRAHARAQRAAEQQLHLQAWRLRQLVPAPASAAS